MLGFFGYWLSQDKEMSHLFDIISCHAGLRFCLIGGGSIVFKYNCVEFYDDKDSDIGLLESTSWDHYCF